MIHPRQMTTDAAEEHNYGAYVDGTLIKDGFESDETALQFIFSYIGALHSSNFVEWREAYVKHAGDFSEIQHNFENPLEVKHGA